MEWMRLELSIEDDLNKQKSIPNVSNIGLDVTAEIMHNSFLSTLPHLDEVKTSHMTMMSEISDTIESDKISSRENRSLDLFLSDIGGILDDSNIKVPLVTEFPKEIIVETCKNGNRNLVRILSPEIFGGMVETFEIGKNQKVSGGKWANNLLELYLE